MSVPRLQSPKALWHFLCLVCTIGGLTELFFDLSALASFVHCQRCEFSRRGGHRTASPRRRFSPRSTASAAPDPWSVLGLEDARHTKPSLKEVRKAFRAAARRTHPDAPGGSTEEFRRVVAAYDKILGAAGVNEKRQRKWKDVDAEGWENFDPSYGDWGTRESMNSFADDDGWCGRDPLKNFFVTSHDAADEGGVAEGDLVIYRLMTACDGKSWGVGRVAALQLHYTKHGPNGLLHINPLMRVQQEGGERLGDVYLDDDPCAEVAMTRVIDRLEVLGAKAGVRQLEGGTFAVAGGSKASERLFSSGMVHIAECESDEECAVPAEECAYEFKNGDRFVVEGAGEPEVNGKYLRDLTVTGAVRFLREAENGLCSICYTESEHWWLASGVEGYRSYRPHYGAPSGGDLQRPPEDGWEALPGVRSPLPSVRFAE